MDRAEFEGMELDDQVAYLNKLVADGMEMDEIEEEVEMTEREMGALGLYYLDEDMGFMGKPMRGYQTAKRSGNEYAATEGGWRNESEITDESSAVHTQLT